MTAVYVVILELFSNFFLGRIAIEDGALVFSFNVKAPGANMADATQFKLIDML